MSCGTSEGHILDDMATLILKIQKDEKIGTALEKYDTEYLWQLGDRILQYKSLSSSRNDTTGEIIRHLENQSIRCLPLLLKNAETARRVWKRNEDYLRIAKGVSYGKLKAALPIFDSDFASHRVERGDLDVLANVLRDSTYEQVLQHVRKLREKYDPRGIAIDFDELYSELYSVNERLVQIANNMNEDAIKAYRERYSSDFIEDTRRLIASMKNEEVFQRLGKSIPKKFVHLLDISAPNFDGEFARVVTALSRIRQATPSLRERLRKRVGIASLGELSTLLKALSNDEELRRYLRGARLLEQIRVGGMMEDKQKDFC